MKLNGIIKTLIYTFLFFYFPNSFAQVILDFESKNDNITLSGKNALIVQNPNKNGNPSSGVAYYLKSTGNWQAISLQFSNVVDIKKNNTLAFLIQSSTKGRVYLKLWYKSSLLKESWAPEYNFQPEPNQWSTATFDLSGLAGKQFDKIEVSAAVDNPAESGVYLDDFRLYNTNSPNGEPVPDLKYPDLAFTDNSLNFDASGSFDPDGDLKTYELDFGNGIAISNTSGNFTYTFNKPFSGKVTLILTDNEGKTSRKGYYLFVMNPDDKISEVYIENKQIRKFEKIEGRFKVNKAYINPYDANEINLNLKIKFQSSGKELKVPCFYYQTATYQNNNWVTDSSGSYWMFRFTSNSDEPFSLSLDLLDTDGQISKKVKDVSSLAPNYKPDFVLPLERFDNVNPLQYFRFKGDNTDVFTPLGINLGWGSMADYTQIMTNLAAAGANTIRYWQVPFNRQALEWKNDGYTHGLMRYSQAAAALNDSLFELAKNLKMFLQPVLFQHGMFSENVNSNWADNPYNIANGGPLNKPEEFFYNETAKKYTKNLLRYIVARWGYSNNIFAWELFNEVQFTGNHPNQSADWKKAILTWHDEMSQYLKSIDPFLHLTTTSASDEQLIQMGEFRGLDILQFHIYDTKLAQKLEEKATEIKTAINYKKPVMCGEFGLDVNTANTPIDNQKVFVWKTTFGGTPSFMWIWDVYKEKKWAEVFTLPRFFMRANKIPSLAESYLARSRHILQTPEYSFNVISTRYETEHVLLNYKEGQRINQLSLPLDRDLLMQNGIYDVGLTDIETGKTENFSEIPLEIEFPLIIKNFDLGKVLTWTFRKKIDYSIPRIKANAVTGQSQKISVDGSASSVYTPDKTVTRWYAAGPGTYTIKSAASSNLIADFSADTPGNYKVFLEMKTGEKLLKDSVNIYVNALPVVKVSEIPKIVPGSYTELYISEISDLENDDVNISWLLAGKPSDSQANIATISKVNARLYADKHGEYMVLLKYSDQYNSPKTDTLNLQSNNILAVEQEEFPAFRVFANPVNEKLILKSGKNSAFSYSLFTSEGKTLLKNISVNQSEIEIPVLDSYPPVFYINLFQENKTFTYKISRK